MDRISAFLGEGRIEVFPGGCCNLWHVDMCCLPCLVVCFFGYLKQAVAEPASLFGENSGTPAGIEVGTLAMNFEECWVFNALALAILLSEVVGT